MRTSFERQGRKILRLSNREGVKEDDPEESERPRSLFSPSVPEVLGWGKRLDNE